MNRSLYLRALEDARQKMRDWTGNEIATVDDILLAVCDVTGDDPQLVAGGSRRARLVAARWLWWACLRKHLGWSLNTVAEFTGCDHSTIVYASKRVPPELVAAVGEVIRLRHADSLSVVA